MGSLQSPDFTLNSTSKYSKTMIVAGAEGITPDLLRLNAAAQRLDVGVRQLPRRGPRSLQRGDEVSGVLHELPQLCDLR